MGESRTQHQSDVCVGWGARHLAPKLVVGNHLLHAGPCLADPGILLVQRLQALSGHALQATQLVCSPTTRHNEGDGQQNELPRRCSGQAGRQTAVALQCMNSCASIMNCRASFMDC
jgi:hypothetical protein